jgi:hypothetical protein
MLDLILATFRLFVVPLLGLFVLREVGSRRRGRTLTKLGRKGGQNIKQRGRRRKKLTVAAFASLPFASLSFVEWPCCAGTLVSRAEEREEGCAGMLEGCDAASEASEEDGGTDASACLVR